MPSKSIITQAWQLTYSLSNHYTVKLVYHGTHLREYIHEQLIVSPLDLFEWINKLS